MAVRNLTVKFLEIRSGAKANRSLRSGDDDDADGELLRVSVVIEIYMKFITCVDLSTCVMLLI